MKQQQIYRVRFPELINGKQDYYFSSLAAIYTVFSHDQIGCRVEHLWNTKVSAGAKYNGKKCSVTRVDVGSKSKRKNE